MPAILLRQQRVFSHAVVFPAKGKKQMSLSFCSDLKLCAGLTECWIHNFFFKTQVAEEISKEKLENQTVCLVI
jgi:hypothetical protein